MALRTQRDCLLKTNAQAELREGFVDKTRFTRLKWAWS